MVIDPIREVYTLLAHFKRSKDPILRARAQRLDESVVALQSQETAAWGDFYDEATALCRTALADGSDDRDRLSPEQRRWVIGLIQKLKSETLHEIEVSGRNRIHRLFGDLRRQTEVNAGARSQDGSLSAMQGPEALLFDSRVTNGRLEVALPSKEIDRWCGWVTTWTQKWSDTVAERQKIRTRERFEAVVEPVSRRVPGFGLQPPNVPDVAAPKVPRLTLQTVSQTAPLPSTAELLFQSFRSGLFMVVALSGVAASLLAAFAKSSPFAGARPVIILVALVIVFGFASQNAASKRRTREAQERLRLEAALRKALRDEAFHHYDVVKAELERWLNGFMRKARDAHHRWGLDQEDRLQLTADQEPSSGIAPAVLSALEARRRVLAVDSSD